MASVLATVSLFSKEWASSSGVPGEYWVNYHYQNHGVKSQGPRTWAWAPSLSRAGPLVGEGR